MSKLNLMAAAGPITDLAITYLPIRDLKPYKGNPRTHSAKQIKQIEKSIRTFGFVNPVLLDGTRGVIAGHGRIEAARNLGMQTVPTVQLDHMTEAQKRAYIIADNKLAENAGWDQELLKLEFEYLSDIDLDFDMTVTGFEVPEIDLIIQGSPQTKEQPPSEIWAVQVPECPVSRPGDLWQIGPHRLYCGDATRPESFDALLGGHKARMVFTDPPYNVSVDGPLSGLKLVEHGNFVMASGEMTESQFTAFLETVFRNLSRACLDGAIHFVCMDWRHVGEIATAGKRAYTEFKNLCIWNKTNGGMGSFYRSKHEMVFVFKQGTAPHVNNIQLGQYGRYRTNVWDYAGVNTFREDRLDELSVHPTVKPTALVADAIMDCSNRKDIILDCFGGSGTTLIAAEKTGRIGYLMELDPKYVDVIISRYQKTFGTEAILRETGQTFSQVRHARTVMVEGSDEQG